MSQPELQLASRLIRARKEAGRNYLPAQIKILERELAELKMMLRQESR